MNIYIYIYIYIVEIKLLVGKVQQILQNNWIKTKLPISKIKRIRYERCDKGNKTDNGYEKTNWNLKTWIRLSPKKTTPSKFSCRNIKTSKNVLRNYYQSSVSWVLWCFNFLFLLDQRYQIKRCLDEAVKVYLAKSWLPTTEHKQKKIFNTLPDTKVSWEQMDCWFTVAFDGELSFTFPRRC